MIQPSAYNAYQQEILEAPLQCLFYRKDRIGVILLTGKRDGLNIPMGILMRIKVSHDQVRDNAKSFPVF